MTRVIIQDNIETLLSNVKGIGVIGSTNPQMLGALTEEEMITLFELPAPAAAAPDLLDDWNFWMVERIATQSDDDGTGPGRVAIGLQLRVNHTFNITGYSPIIIKGAASNGPDFQALTDRVLAIFKDEPSLGGFDAQPMQLVTLDTQMAVGMVCHHAACRITVTEIENVQRTNWR